MALGRRSVHHLHPPRCERSRVQVCGRRRRRCWEQECREEERSGVVEVPHEVCSLSPSPVCTLVRRLVPRLEEERRCREVPSIVCDMVQTCSP